SLALYYATGFLAAYDQTGAITTFTVCRAYKLAPDGALDGEGARIQFGGGVLKGTILSLMSGQTGTSFADVQILLGPPDGEGTVTLGNQQLPLLSYGFIGIEVFAPIGTVLPSDVTLFVSVHAPYYGLLKTSQAGVGSARMDIEQALGMVRATTSQNQ